MEVDSVLSADPEAPSGASSHSAGLQTRCETNSARPHASIPWCGQWNNSASA